MRYILKFTTALLFLVITGNKVSDVEPEQNDVPVFHHVFLAFGADQAFFFGGGHAAAGHQVVVGDYLGADEAAFEVAVNLAGGLGGFGAHFDGPGAAFLGTGGEVADQAQEAVAGGDEFFQAGLGDS